MDFATSGGEDYELLVTITKDAFEEIQQKFEQQMGKKLYNIGSIERGDPLIMWYMNGSGIAFTGKGYDHFS